LDEWFKVSGFLELVVNIVLTLSLFVTVAFMVAIPVNYCGATERKIEMETTQKVFNEARKRFDNNPVEYLENIGITTKIAELNSELAQSKYYATETFWKYFMDVETVMMTEPIK